MKSESVVQQEIQIAAGFEGCSLMRNNSGAFKDETGRMVRYGLGNVSKQQSEHIKSSDLIGFKTIMITPEMVGQKVAVFTAIEVKKQGWKYNPNDKREAAQFNFMNWVVTMGGIAGFASSVDEFKTLVKR